MNVRGEEEEEKTEYNQDDNYEKEAGEGLEEQAEEEKAVKKRK